MHTNENLIWNGLEIIEWRGELLIEKNGGLNGSLQHLLEVCKQKLSKAKFVTRH
jgi:hypothetical protein